MNGGGRVSNARDRREDAEKPRDAARCEAIRVQAWERRSTRKLSPLPRGSWRGSLSKDTDMTEFFNRPTEKNLRRRWRKQRPPAEVLLWSRLRGKQLMGRKFRRQYSVGPYSIDLYCPAAKLAIELDGDSHFAPGAKIDDAQRQRFIESFGIRFLRFTNPEIYDNLDGVLEAIAAALASGE